MMKNGWRCRITISNIIIFIIYNNTIINIIVEELLLLLLSWSSAPDQSISRSVKYRLVCSLDDNEDDDNDNDNNNNNNVSFSRCKFSSEA